MSATLLPAVVRNASKTHTASLIFLHGLGDSGHGWSSIGEQLAKNFPYVKFIFPHAPEQPVTLNMGMKMPSWYDITSLNDIDAKQDESGMLCSVQKVNQFIQAEIDSGIPANRIVIGGFSQGCVISLLTMLKSERTFAGLIGLSGYLPLHNKILSLASEASKRTPIFWGHGEEDEIVAFKLGKMTNDFLLKAGYQMNFNSYPGMAHSACPEEILAMASFLSKVLPPTS